jgi:hypothetical protein
MIQPPLGLLTHLIALRSALYEQWAARANEPVVKLDSPTHLKLELLPYAVSEMWHAFTSFICTTQSIAVKLDEDIPIHPECFFLSDSDRDLLAYSIDAFMSAGRRAQNAVLFYLSSALRQSLPASLSDVFTKQGQTDLRKYPVLGPFAAILESYWQADGQTLRAYRVLMEHHTLVASEAFLARSDAGTVVLHMLLPSNPDAGSPTELIYGNPPVHVLPYMEQAFIALVRFAESMTWPLLPIPLPQKAHIIVANRIAPIRTHKVFHPIPLIEEISARVKQSIQARHVT